MQVAYIPLIVTFVALITSEAEGNYANKKWIIIASCIGILGLALVGFSLLTVAEYGITEINILNFKFAVNNNSITTVMYIFITIITFWLSLLGLEKIAKV